MENISSRAGTNNHVTVTCQQCHIRISAVTFIKATNYLLQATWWNRNNHKKAV